MIRKETRKLFKESALGDAIKHVQDTLVAIAKTRDGRLEILNAMNDACEAKLEDLKEEFVSVLREIADQVEDGFISIQEASDIVNEKVIGLSREEKQICDEAAYDVIMKLGKRESYNRRLNRK